MNEILLEVSRTEYFADMLTDLETLNSSTGHQMVSRSPRHGWAQHPRLGGRPRAPSSDMELGTIIDEILLGKSERIVKVDFPDFRTKAAQSARDEAKAAGKLPVIAEKYQELVNEVNGATKAMEFAGINVEELQTQVCVLWEERASNGAIVQCRGLLDMFDAVRIEIIDLKTGTNNHPDFVGNKAVKFGYAMQAAAYTSAIEHNIPDLAGRVPFSNVWIENSFPHVAYKSEFSGELMQYGRVMWQRSIDLWEECTRTGKWPGYAVRGERVRIELPTWAKEQMYKGETETEEEGEGA